MALWPACSAVEFEALGPERIMPLDIVGVPSMSKEQNSRWLGGRAPTYYIQRLASWKVKLAEST